jgi:N-acetyl-gamma-glutamyl-phosphate reductase
MKSRTVKVGVAGATGYAGQELIRLAARHPSIDVAVATSSNPAAARPSPRLSRVWDGSLAPFSMDALAAGTEAVFLALPDDVAATAAPALVERGVRVFDLSGAFRLRQPALRQRWYPHSPSTTPDVAYGLTEHNRDAVRKTRLVACPGCYPTAALLALQPLASLLAGDVVIDAKSGVSGAGKNPTERTHFSEVHGSMSAYGVFAHRHSAEIEQELDRQVTFVPHLVPLDRGILETIYVRLAPGVGAADIARALEDAYADAPFVRLTGDALPEIKHVAHTNFCDIGWRVDPAADAASGGARAVIVSCLDNLVKGAGGQAIQNFNVAFGLDERAGLV